LARARRWLRAFDAGAARHDRCEHRQQGRQRDRRHDKSRPDEGGVRGSSHPASNAATLAGGDDVRRRLSSIFHGRSAAVRRGRGERIAPAQDPRQQLQSARPAMLARGGYVISRRKFLNDLDVGDQTGARKFLRRDRG